MYYLDTKPFELNPLQPDLLDEMAKLRRRLRGEFLVKEAIKIGQQTIITTEDVEPGAILLQNGHLIFKEQ